MMDVQGAGFAVDAQAREDFQKTDFEPGEGFSYVSFGVGKNLIIGK